MKNNNFWKIAKANAETVRKWPKWMQEIKITAYTANTGEFIRNNAEATK